MTKFIGIDPGTTRIGYGIIEERAGRLSAVSWGLVEKNPKRAADRVHSAAALRSLISKHSPVAAGIERLFFMKNQRTAMAVSEMRGVIVLIFRELGIPIHEFTPQQVKRTVTGHGGASKRQVQDMVRVVLNIEGPVTPDDAADGLALAICCATAKPY